MTIGYSAPDIAGLSFVRQLGEGGYARVYLYEMQMPRLEVAVKVMDSDLLSHDALDRFMGEANDMAKLSHHPYIAQVHRADVTSDGRPYIVMKYYPGDTYGVRVRQAPFAVSEALRAGVRIACAVETAHRAEILHRDIKPANILTDQYDIPALTDFGIAVAADHSRTDAEGMSLPWAPPETVYSTSRPTVAADVYSLGATIWHLLVGRSPFHELHGDNSTIALMRRIETSAPPTTHRGDVPASLERVLTACLAKEPDDRPSTALDLARALQAIEQEQHLAVTQLTLLEAAPTRRAEPLNGGDETWIRAPQTVVPQPVDDTRNRSPRVTRGSYLPESAPAAETVRRPTPRDREAEVPVVPPPSRAGRRVAVAALAAVTALAGIGYVVLAPGAHAPKRTTSTPVVPESVGFAASPGTPHVHAARSANARARRDTIVFRWSGYDNTLPSDTFRWRRSGSGGPTSGTSAKPTLRVVVKRDAVACLAVQVVRHDGSEPSSFSDPVCAVR